jgi:hypothetical protein
VDILLLGVPLTHHQNYATPAVEVKMDIKISDP